MYWHSDLLGPSILQMYICAKCVCACVCTCVCVYAVTELESYFPPHSYVRSSRTEEGVNLTVSVLSLGCGVEHTETAPGIGGSGTTWEQQSNLQGLFSAALLPTSFYTSELKLEAILAFRP